MIFVDTSYLVALAEPRDSLHSRAMAWAKVLRDRLLVSEYVVVETVNALSNQASRERAHRIINLVRADPGYEWIDATPALLTSGLDLHRRAADKDWSLTDCISFHLMREHGVTRALTHDHHFEQAGFEALLRRDPP